MINELEIEVTKYSQILIKLQKEKAKLLNVKEQISTFSNKNEIEKGLNKELESNKQKIKEIVNKIDKLEDKVKHLEKENKELKENKFNQDGSLWLTDVIDIEKPNFDSNNLILSPVGSGKTTLIKERLIKDVKGTAIMLVSTSQLRKSTVSPCNIEREKRADRMITIENDKIFGDKEYTILVMTYSQFGSKVNEDMDFLKEIEFIFCDEIHSLIEYETYSKNRGLILAQEYLFNKQNNKTIYYFTATEQNLLLFKKKYPTKMKDIKTFDYREYKDIKKYISLREENISHSNQIRNILKEFNKGDFKNYGYKGLIYSKTISSMKKIEEILIEEGFNPLVLWSVNNSEYEMNNDQLKAMEELMITEKIPEPYNFLIINGAMREGWDLKDHKVQLAIMNTVNETDQIQARGRIRNNIANLVIKVPPSENEDKTKVVVKDKYLNRQLKTKDKEELCVDLNIYKNTGLLAKWPSVKNIIINSGYTVDDTTIRIDRKQVRVSEITEDKDLN